MRQIPEQMKANLAATLDALERQGHGAFARAGGSCSQCDVAIWLKSLLQKN